MLRQLHIEYSGAIYCVKSKERPLYGIRLTKGRPRLQRDLPGSLSSRTEERIIAAASLSYYSANAMGKRSFRSYCAFVIRHYVLDLPGMLLLWPAVRSSPSEIRHGIRVIDAFSQSQARFANMVGQALELIAASDPVRLKRIQGQVSAIVNCAGIIGSVYAPALKVCGVNLRCFGRAGDAQSVVKLLASIFVYEATFGYVMRQGCLRTRRNRNRFDRLRRKEAQRFMQRLGMTETPWDTEPLPPHALVESFKIWLTDVSAAQREATLELHDNTGPI